MLSIIIPLYNESENIPFLIERINKFIISLNQKVEVIFVDDHSEDNTPTLLKKYCEENQIFKFLRLSKNCGSHIAIIAGLQHCKGDCAVFLAADLQDPPELISEMITKWKENNDVVWAVRETTEGISIFEKLFSRLYYFLINISTDISMPPKGADFALLDRKVINALLKSVGAKPSLGALITWLGYKQVEIKYIKEARKFGKSGWTLKKKINALLDAFVGFSVLPLRIMSYLGFTFSILGFIYSAFIILLRFKYDKPIVGWTSIMVAVMVLGGLQMLMLGLVGEYLWRNLEEARKRPLFLIEEQVDLQ
jgi:glycosyltransferase involved in cell wall biosynthesis